MDSIRKYASLRFEYSMIMSNLSGGWVGIVPTLPPVISLGEKHYTHCLELVIPQETCFSVNLKNFSHHRYNLKLKYICNGNLRISMTLKIVHYNVLGIQCFP